MFKKSESTVHPLAQRVLSTTTSVSLKTKVHFPPFALDHSWRERERTRARIDRQLKTIETMCLSLAGLSWSDSCRCCLPRNQLRSTITGYGSYGPAHTARAAGDQNLASENFGWAGLRRRYGAPPATFSPPGQANRKSAEDTTLGCVSSQVYPSPGVGPSHLYVDDVIMPKVCVLIGHVAQQQ